MKFSHRPVLYKEILSLLDCKPGDIIVDGTLGGGGHAYGILEKITPGGILIGIDRDPEALGYSTKRLSKFGDSFISIQGNFSNIDSILEGLNISSIDGMVLDIGISSPQVDNPNRGFSYMHNAPLDMRMNPDQEFSAYDVVNTYSRSELSRILWEYGEERWSSRIAKFIVDNRPIETTGELVEVIKAAIPAGARRKGPHPAKRTFQAIRIEVNRELESLKIGLEKGIEVLKSGGRLCVISFHSLEDTIVKRTFKNYENPCICPNDAPICICGRKPKIKIITRKPLTAKGEELKINPRARSAKLRVCQKL
ncbi:MAG TPA: 16S rRNA (cytosine(1402)-N(4))-methyltransferase RsmH [Clostridiales bacterium]|nr:16S rRNA (cytosine(1402)-N(4))-methyltransferase RsmH [Clostridiales bacterium]